MRLRLAALLAAALCLMGCGSPAAEPARDWPAPSPALWEVSRDGAPAAWLFGTVHALPAGVEWRTAALDAALDEADLLLVEIAELDDRTTARAAFEALSRSPGLPPLMERVPASEQPRLAALLEAAGMDEADLAGRESWAAALVLASATRRNDPANGVDRALLDEGMQAVGLESHAAQYGRFDALSQRAQGQLLLSVADDAISGETDTLIEAWLTGDLTSLTALTEGRLMGDHELRKGLVTARNRAWADRIAVLAESGGQRAFVAVGAGHMLGEHGLPALLAARGFTVRRLQ